MKQGTKPVKLGSVEVGAKGFALITGPCAIESKDQFFETAKRAKDLGACALRGGLFKLRTDPSTFQGLGTEAFEIAKMVKKEVSLPFVSEVTDPRQVEVLEGVVDAFQVGSRNMHNYALLKELGKTQKPIVLKRGLAALFKEWILAAEHVVKAGNENIILCERGIRTFETSTRNTFDLNSLVLAKKTTPFPVLADPSHGTGDARLVPDLSLAAAACGADGLLIEMHPRPSEALSDGYQSLNFDQMSQLVEKLEKVLSAVDRELL